MSATVASRKRRGRDTEHAVAAYLAEHGWPHAEAVGAGAPGRDIKGVPGVAIEVKARRGFEPKAAMTQAIRNAGEDVPVVIVRPDGCGPATLAAWPAVLPVGTLVALLRLAGFGGPATEEDGTCTE